MGGVKRKDPISTFISEFRSLPSLGFRESSLFLNTLIFSGTPHYCDEMVHRGSTAIRMMRSTSPIAVEVLGCPRFLYHG